MKATRVNIFTILLLFSSCQKDGMTNGLINQKPQEHNVVETASILYVGSYTEDMGWVNGRSDGIQIFKFLNGKLEKLETVKTHANPSFLKLHPTKKYLFAVHEEADERGQGQVASYSIAPSGKLTMLNTMDSGGAYPCHISVSSDGKRLYVANYGNGSIAMYRLGLQGHIESMLDQVQFVGSGGHERQDGPHAHFIQELDGEELYTADLGTDSIRVYDISDDSFIYKYGYAVSPTAGPRHIARHRDLQTTYILNELSGTIEAWIIKSEGRPIRIQTISSLHPDNHDKMAHAAAIKIGPDGKFLYCSNRGDINSISSYQIGKEGRLEFIDSYPTLGRTPRDFELDPSGKFLLIANQDTDQIIVYHLHDGRLSQPTIWEEIWTPTCLQFLPAT